MLENHYVAMHFSWLFLLFALIWATVSLVVFSNNTIHILNETTEIELGIADTDRDWTIKGDSASFELCDRSLCLKSAAAKLSSLVFNVPVDTAELDDADYFLLDMKISSRTNTEYVELEGRPSVVFVSPLGENQERYRLLRPMVFLEEGQDSQRYREVTAIRNGIEALRLLFVVRSTGAWKVHYIRIHTVSYSVLYNGMRWLVFGGWVLALILLTLRVQPSGETWVKLIRGAIFSAVLIVGLGTLAPIVWNALSALLIANGLEGFALSNTVPGSWQVYSHVLLHLSITLYLCFLSPRLTLNCSRIIALNLVLAIGIECTQMGIPSRTAEVGDIELALSGAVVAMVIHRVSRYLKMRLIPA